MSRAEKPVTLAVIVGAHGVTGEARLKLFTDNLDGLKAFKSFNDGKLTATSLRPNKGGAIARFAEAKDRNAAEALRGTELTVPRGSLPSLEAGEYYYVDLIGLPVVSTTGQELGVVTSVENFGAGDVLDIRLPDGKNFMVPMNEDAVPEWGDRLVVSAEFAP